MEIRKAPNDTAALSFVANSEAARYVFVVVVVHDAMDRGRRYGTFVLAWLCVCVSCAWQRACIGPRGPIWEGASTQGVLGAMGAWFVSRGSLHRRLIFFCVELGPL